MKPDAPVPPQNPPVTRGTRFVRLGIRAVCIALILWGGWSITQSIMILFQNSRGGDEVPREEPATTHDPLLDVLESTRPEVAHGYWESAGASWKIGQAQLSTHEIDARIEQLNHLHGAAGFVANANENELLKVLPQLGFKRVERSGGYVYSLNNEKCRIRLVTDANANLEVIAGGLAAFRNGPAQWTVVEIRQAPETSTPKAGLQIAHLLPMPEITKRQIARVAEDGDLQLEVLTLPGLNFDLTDSWKSAGWSIVDSPSRMAGDFNFVCEREGTVIHAWAPEIEGSSGVLVLVKSGMARAAEGGPQAP